MRSFIVEYFPLGLAAAFAGVALLVFACARAAGLADRQLESLETPFEVIGDRPRLRRADQ